MESRPPLVEEDATATPFADQPPIDPAQALSDEVDHVREYGDPLDPVKSLALGNVLLRAAIPAVVATEVIEATPGTSIRFVAGGIALGATLLYENGRSALLDRKRAKRRLREDARETAEATGQFTEFYRTGKPFKRDVTLMWYGPPTTAKHPQTGAAGLLRTVDLARQAGVEKIAVPSSIAKSFVSEDVPPYGTYRKWLLHRKQRLVFGKAAKEPIYEASPDQWVEHISSTNDSALNGLIQLLGKVYPDHPIVRTAAFYAHVDPELRRKQLLGASQDAVDRRLSDIEGMRVDRHDPQAPFYPYKRKAALVTGTFTADGIIQRYLNGHADTVTTVATEMNLTEERIKQLLKDPRIDVVRGPQAVELSILRLLKEQKQPTVPVRAAGESGEEADDTSQVPFQARLLRLNHQQKGQEQHRRPKLIGHRLGRLALAGALVTGIGFGVNYAQGVGQKSQNNAYASAYIEVAHKLGVPDTSAQITDPEVYAQMYADHPWLRYWNDTNRYASDIGKFLVHVAPSDVCFGPCPAPGSQPVAGANGDSFLGNASDGQPNKVDWALDPHGMSAAGDWAETTSAMLYAEQKDINSYAPDIFWESELPVYDGRTFPDTFNPARHPAYIAVSRHLQTGDNFMGESSNTNSSSSNISTSAKTENLFYYFLPVRADSSLVAVDYTVDGKPVPVRVLPQPNGTYDLAIPSQESRGDLTYWIVPSHNRPHALKPNGYDPIGDLPFDQAAFDKEVAQLLDPDFYTQTPAERAAAVEAAIGNNFLYAVDPTVTNEMRGVRTFAGYEYRILLRRTDNCNEANTTLALVDPELNTVTGYSDNGSPDQQHGLYSHSTHMYDVDAHGNEYDATPVHVPPAEQAYFSTKGLPSPKHAPMPLPWDVGGAVLLFSGIGAWQRRRIGRGINHARSTYGNRLQQQLVAQGATALISTVEIVERGLYGPGLDIESSLRRAASRQRTAEATATATKLVTRPDLHAASVSRMLKQAQPTANGHRQTVDTSRQIIRKARLARRILPRAAGKNGTKRASKQ
jgi:hypothetical protein